MTAQTYRDALAELDRILKSLEEEPELDDLLARVERGATLYRFCHGHLQEVEARLREILTGLE